jgi:L-ascorbate metabolism protein UlaG (beta-lactamase superfamily)
VQEVLVRWRPGRPDIAAYVDHFDVPAAGPTGLSVTFLGVATLLFDDGGSAVMTDGFFSRPGLLATATGRLRPDHERIASALDRAGVGDLDVVVPVHTHYDHALDTAVVAERTGASVLGGASAANVARGGGLAEERVVVAEPGVPTTWGSFTVTLVESEHCPPDRFPGTIDAPVVPPARASAYRCGEAWSMLVEHRPSDRTALVVGSAGYVEGSLGGHRAEVAYLGVGQLGHRGEGYIRTFWHETVRTVGARRVVLVHWDDFLRPLDEPPRALPYLGDDVGRTWRVLRRLAEQDAVELHFPILWRREDPWAA